MMNCFSYHHVYIYTMCLFVPVSNSSNGCSVDVRVV